MFFVFGRCLTAGFISFDDPIFVTVNEPVTNGLTWAGLQWALTTCHAANWHPLVWLTLMFDCELFGVGPFGFHLTNVLLHSANAALLFLALRELTGEAWRPALAAALFAVHPLRVESVAWISERKDVLSGLFWMLSLWCYALHIRRGRTVYWWLCLLSFSVGLTAKQMIVTLPCVLVLIDIWPLLRGPA